MINERYETETVSNSGLGALSISPMTYRRYKDNQNQESASFFNVGSAVHCKVLEPKEFNDRFIIMNIETPSPMYEAYIKALIRTRPAEAGDMISQMQLSSWIINAHAESGFKWSSDKVWENFNNDPKLKGYYDILLKAEGKVVLSESDGKAIDACVEGIKSHAKASELLYGHLLSTTNNEQEVIWRHPKFPKFKMKSIFDRLIVNTAKKQVILVDIKSTSKSVYDFKYSYKTYKYYRQMALYRQAVIWYLQDQKLNPSEWTINVYMVVTQTNGYGTTAVYEVCEKDLLLGEQEAELLLNRMTFHFDSDLWEHPMEYYTSDGILTLSLDADI